MATTITNGSDMKNSDNYDRNPFSISNRRTEVVSKQRAEMVLPMDTSRRSYLRPCYFTNWSQYRQGRGKYLPEDYVPGLCTHILYAFGWMNEDFTVRAYDPADLDQSWAKGMYSRVNDLKKTDPQLKTLLSIGGWTFGTRLFKKMAESFESRKIFIDSAIVFTRQHNFDGIDIDWEYPKGDEDKENYSMFVKELREACDAESARAGITRLLVTAAVSAGDATISNAYDIPEIAKYYDFILLMSYDFHGAWEKFTGMNSPLYGRKDEPQPDKVNWNVNWAANHWYEMGMPKEKIIIGLATYGRGWTLDNPDVNGLDAPASQPAEKTKYVREAGVASYYEFCEMLNQGAIRVWDSEQQVPYLVHGNQWFSYDDEQSFRAKLRWLKQNGYGGAFVWTMDFDDFNGQCSNGGGQKYPLLNIIAQELSGPVLPTPRPVVTTTTAVPRVSECFGKRDGFHPDASNCRDFIQCLHGRKYSLSCPGQLYYGKSFGYCVERERAECGASSSTRRTTPPVSRSTPGPIVTTPRVSRSTRPPRFQCQRDGFQPDPASCNHFYRCANRVSHRFSCPGNLCFDSKTSLCQYPSQCDCKNTQNDV